MSGRLETSVIAQELRETPVYPLSEAAHYLLIPGATLRSWVVGRPYPVKRGTRYFQPLLRVRSGRGVALQLSFLNLVEAHVLDAIRRVHQIPLSKVRAALEYLRGEFGSKHPLAEQRMETDGRDLFVRKYGQLINASQEGQLAMLEILSAHLRRIEWDSAGLAARLFPFTRKRDPNEPKVIVMDPGVSFGRPVLYGTGIATAVVAERYKAGESVEELAEDYRRPTLEIQEAIRCELSVEAA